VKITGLILVVIGFVAGAICAIVLAQPNHLNSDVPANTTGAAPPNMILPLAVCGAAVVIGGLMILFGGRGYFISNNPRVRN